MLNLRCLHQKSDPLTTELYLLSPGVIRDSSCTYVTSWQSYKCFGLTYKLMVIESLDPDTETRRLSPVAVLGGSYVDLLNGNICSSPTNDARHYSPVAHTDIRLISFYCQTFRFIGCYQDVVYSANMSKSVSEY